MSATTALPATLSSQLHMETSRPSPTVALVTVVGEVDLATVSLFRDWLISVLHDETHAVIDVDLAGVSFLDCAGVGALVLVRTIAVHAGRQMRVTHLQPAIRRILELTGLLNALTGPIDHSEQRPQSSIQPVFDPLPRR